MAKTNRSSKNGKAGTRSRAAALQLVRHDHDDRNFVPIDNPNELRKQNPLIGDRICETINQVNSVLCVVSDAALHEAPWDETRGGIDLLMRMVRDALDMQSEFLVKHQRKIGAAGGSQGEAEARHG